MLSAVVPGAAQAAKGMKGFNTLRDTGDGYELAYPFGWQEVQVSGVDAVYKDVIEPLESVAVQLVPTDKQSITEYGTANEIAGTLAKSVFTTQKDELQLIKSESEKDDNDGGRCARDNGEIYIFCCSQVSCNCVGITSQCTL